MPPCPIASATLVPGFDDGLKLLGNRRFALEQEWPRRPLLPNWQIQETVPGKPGKAGKVGRGGRAGRGQCLEGNPCRYAIMASDGSFTASPHSVEAISRR